MKINEATWQFIHEHTGEDVRQLALQGTKAEDVNLLQALQQIAGRQMARKKLPSWTMVEGIIYPPHLNMEQCSSEQTARYKQKTVERLMTESREHKEMNSDETGIFVDLTGGFGVDFYWMSQGFRQRYYVEKSAELCGIAENNFRLLGLECTICQNEAETYLANMNEVDVLFLDPARRNEHGGRTYSIEDCTPNLLEILPELFKKAHFIVIKLSPMLDWRKAASDLGNVREIHIISVDNECKELLLVLSSEHTEAMGLICINNDTAFQLFTKRDKHFLQVREISFPKEKENLYKEGTNEKNLSHQPPAYLYEPNSSIMKAGCFEALETYFPISQISNNSHLFVSSVGIGNFPGRKFQIQAISTMNKQELRRVLETVERANISVRNFPLTAEQLRKKLKLKDGGDVYIFATTTSDGVHKLFFCRKIG